MLIVNGKEVLFKTWFIIEHDGSASVDLPMFPNRTAKFEIRHLPAELQDFESPRVRVDRTNWEHNVGFSHEEGAIKFMMPYLREHAANVTPVSVFLKNEVGNFSAHISRQALAGAMLVHFVLYIERGEKTES